ncbi:uncharacterized protein TrAtP1_012888 [Trichoderma atroviride]|uniref:uncharacterized protein n=1 Tax=Hypocrea atroviridis TaxID=63577 RepID=UPI0033346FB6|nr:hypothetical protein TrAtP1_012888 [Trichoderma atroviride]
MLDSITAKPNSHGAESRGNNVCVYCIHGTVSVEWLYTHLLSSKRPLLNLTESYTLVLPSQNAAISINSLRNEKTKNIQPCFAAHHSPQTATIHSSRGNL